MKYISTRNNKKTYNFIDTFLNGLAHDGGLYIPKIIPRLSNATLQKFSKLNYDNFFSKFDEWNGGGGENSSQPWEIENYFSPNDQKG